MREREQHGERWIEREAEQERKREGAVRCEEPSNVGIYMGGNVLIACNGDRGRCGVGSRTLPSIQPDLCPTARADHGDSWHAFGQSPRVQLSWGSCAEVTLPCGLAVWQGATCVSASPRGGPRPFLPPPTPTHVHYSWGEPHLSRNKHYCSVLYCKQLQLNQEFWWVHFCRV